ncbi:MAG TPA: hypothetical protein VG405_09060 [Solirubrobacteraceae bacterium]|jgi:hypothetical protein|nr:hypothetical protein [Solirubrobacteraceae bacterium]
MNLRSTDRPEPLAVLLLPTALERFELAEHARELLTIPRVVALEPSRFGTSRLLRDSAALRQARRLRFPGRPWVLVLYHPEQYRLARALMARYAGAELWYVERDLEELESRSRARPDELRELDELARERATPDQMLAPGLDSAEAGSRLRLHLQALGIISQHPFVPGGRPLRRSR